MSSNAVLHPPNLLRYIVDQARSCDNRYSLDTDASSEQIRVAKFQEDAERVRETVRVLVESAETSQTKQYLALDLNVRTLRPYLLMCDFDVEATHNNGLGSFMRWQLTISDFKYTVNYKKRGGRTSWQTCYLSCQPRDAPPSRPVRNHSASRLKCTIPQIGLTYITSTK